MALQPNSAALAAEAESALSKDEVAAALQALKLHLESGEPLGKNEHGEDFIEIQEVWEDGIQPPQFPTPEGGGGFEEDKEPSIGWATEDDENFDNLMEEIEALELEDDNVGKPLPAGGSAGSQSGGTTGLKRGFLLDSTSTPGTTREAAAAAADVSTAAITSSKATARANVYSRDAPFIGGVVERQPGGSRPPSHLARPSGRSITQECGDRIENEAPAVEQPRISRFKQQRYGGY